MKRRTCGAPRARRKTLRSRPPICRPIASRALSSGSTAAASAGLPSISSLARAVNVFNLHRPMTSPKFLEQPSDLVLEIPLQLDEQGATAQKSPDGMAIEILDAN